MVFSSSFLLQYGKPLGKWQRFSMLNQLFDGTSFYRYVEIRDRLLDEHHK